MRNGSKNGPNSLGDFQKLNLFQSAVHKPFTWQGKDGPAALLVHGFPGTPAEMRALAESLHGQGWTTHGVLLPGFGADFPSLMERDPQEWIDATVAAARELVAEHDEVYLIGYSMGGAVALQTAVQVPGLAGLVLLAPFWRVGTWWTAGIWHTLRRIWRELRPFRKLDFTEPRIRQALTDFIPDLDLDDAETVRMLREVVVPTQYVQDVFNIGRGARRCAPRMQLPTLIIQGKEDPVITPRRSHQLFHLLPNGRRYLELDADHELMKSAAAPYWPALTEAVLNFRAELFAEQVETAVQTLSRP